MKKILLAIVVLAFLLFSVGCVKNQDEKTNKNGSVQVNAEGYDENMEVDW